MPITLRWPRGSSVVTRRLAGSSDRRPASTDSDRGRIDLVGFHPAGHALLVAELKTSIVDGQELIGTLDMKARVAPYLARELGWQARAAIPELIVLESTTPRRRLRELAPLLGRYWLRGAGALAWLRNPTGAPSGLLLVVKRAIQRWQRR